MKIIISSMLLMLIVLSGIQLIIQETNIKNDEDYCSNVQGGYIQGISMNHTTIIAKVPTNKTQMLQDLCIVANTPKVFIVSSQWILNPNSQKTESEPTYLSNLLIIWSTTQHEIIYLMLFLEIIIFIYHVTY